LTETIDGRWLWQNYVLGFGKYDAENETAYYQNLMNNNATAFDDSYNLAEFNLLFRGLGLPT
jgi:hypothetical protein